MRPFFIAYLQYLCSICLAIGPARVCSCQDTGRQHILHLNQGAATLPRKSKQHRPSGWRPASERWREVDDKRGSSTQRGYGHKWRKARERHLKQEPCCRICRANGVVTAADVVDHIVPHKGNKKLFWNSSNWQSLCTSCHNSKTAREDGGFGRTRD